MMSIETPKIPRRSSAISMPASAGKLKLCHMCGDAFPKSSLPSHQRGCIRKTLSTPNNRITLSAGTDGSSAANCSKCTYEIYGHDCDRNIPSLKFSSHFQFCQGNDTTTEFQSKINPRASAPSVRRGPAARPFVTKSASYSFNATMQDYQETVAAVAAETSTLPKRSFSLPSSKKINRMDPPESIPTEFSRPPSRANTGRASATERKTSIELSMKKKNSKSIPSSTLETSSELYTFSSSMPSSPAPPPQQQQQQQYQQFHKPASHSRGASPPPPPPPAVKKAPHDSFHENEDDERLDVTDYLIPCNICGRKFMENRLDKHKEVCYKTKSKTRKVFDVRAARVAGTDMEKYLRKGTASAAEEPIKPKKSNWRAKHEAFRQMVISARQPAGSKPLIPAVDPNPDYITCPCCDRRFNEESGKRHIPICKEKAAKKALERPSASRGGNSSSPAKDKMEELKRRTAYKPPSPRKPARK